MAVCIDVHALHELILSFILCFDAAHGSYKYFKAGKIRLIGGNRKKVVQTGCMSPYWIYCIAIVGDVKDKASKSRVRVLYQ